MREARSARSLQRVRPRLIELVLAGVIGGTMAGCAGIGALGENQSAIEVPAPTAIACQGNQRDTVRITWRDNATDETEYRVERQIDASGWAEIKSLPANATLFDDEHADVSEQNRHYRVRAFRSSDNSFSAYSDVCNNRRIFETTHFRIFYGVIGTDECPMIDSNRVCLMDIDDGSTNKFVKRASDALEGSLAAFDRVGFRAGSAGTPPAGLDKIPINVVWCDGGGCAGGGGLGLSPALLEANFDLVTRAGDPVAWMVALHESFHFQQYQYPGLNDPAGKWAYEGQARSVQDKLCIGADRGTCNAFDDIDVGDGGYVPQVRSYLGQTSEPINQASYDAALFWTYMTEKFGTSAPSDTVENGMNMLVAFWEAAQNHPGGEGITAVNNALTALGHAQRYRDIWKDFAVASYAKGLSGPGVQAKYRYEDMSEPGGTYGPVTSLLSTTLAPGDQLVASGLALRPWSANYYELLPTAGVPVIDIKVTQDGTVPVYYTILGIKGTDVTFEYNTEARNLDRTLVNNAYDKVVVIVAGLESLANYRYSFNGTQPTLKIDSPTTGNPARVGDPAAPDKFRVAVEMLAGDGTPLAGVDRTQFTFRVGTQDVPAAGILTSATIQGQQWFILQAPQGSLRI